MIWDAHLIPIVLPPLPGEALDSWIEAYAARLRTSSRQLLNLIGLPRAQTGQLVVTTTTEEQRALARATGVPAHQLSGMTLTRFHSIAVTISGRRLGRSPTWRGTDGTRFCPRCLERDQGRWQLHWRSPWQFCCPQHAVLLVDHCPQCHARPIPARLPHHLHKRGMGICDFPLHTIPVAELPEDGLTLQAQTAVNHIIAGSDPETARQQLHDLHTLAWLALQVLQAEAVRNLPALVQRALADHQGDIPPAAGPLVIPNAHSTAVGTTIALNVFDAFDLDAQHTLSWIVTSDRQRRHIGSPSEFLSPYRNVSPQLSSRILKIVDASLKPGLRLKYGSPAPHPRLRLEKIHTIHERAARVPAMLWPSWSMRLALSNESGNNRPGRLRAALSVMLLLPASPRDFTYRQAASCLGHHDSGQSVRYMINTRPERLSPIFSSVFQLATMLDQHGSPINYARRRQRLILDNTHIDRDAYANLCSEHGWPRNTKRRLKLLDLYLFTTLTGTDIAKDHLTTNATMKAWNDLRLYMPPELRHFLHQQAEAVLAAHGIHEEPVTWEPPATWVQDVTWPGLEPDHVDTEAFRQLSTQRFSVTRAANQMGMSGENVRLYAEVTGLTLANPPHRIVFRSNTKRARQGPLAPDQLRDLYVNQRQSMATIATLVGGTKTLVAGALRDAGIPARPPGMSRRYFLSREWFIREHINHRRTIRDLAHEAGVSPTTVARHARRWGITITRWNEIPGS